MEAEQETKRKPRFPKHTLEQIAAVAEFLYAARELADDELFALSATHIGMDSAYYQGQLSYSKNKLSAVKWLLAINSQRKANNETSKSG